MVKQPRVLHFAFCILPFSFLVAISLAPAQGAEPLLGTLKRQHPRLLLDAAGFEELARRVKSDPVLADWDRQVRRQADRLLDAPLSRHVIPDGLRLLATSRAVVDRSYTLGLMFRLHGDRRYAERLWRELEAVAAFPDFNPRHFLDTAEMTHALAIAYDWLYDTWTVEQRAVIRRAMVQLGLKPGLAAYRGGGWWPKATHNWNQVCNGGMAVGALAIADEEPQLAEEIVRQAVASVRLAMASYSPDGAWVEGPGYWNYATSYTVLLIAALESSLGSDFDLASSPGFSQTGLFPIYMAGPTGRMFNFADAGEHFGGAPCLEWLARRFDQPACAAFADSLKRPSAAGMIWRISRVARGEKGDSPHLPERPEGCFAQMGTVPFFQSLPLDRYWRGAEAVTMRSRWNDPNALFVGLHAGSNQANHNHLDQGSFVLDALGQRWAVDLGPDDYNLPGYFGPQRYDYYRLRAEGHNTLLIDPGRGPDQDPKAAAKIGRHGFKPERAFAIADLTPLYTHARRVERGVALLDRRAVLVQDEISAANADVWWFLHTPAELALAGDGRSATLRLPSPSGRGAGGEGMARLSVQVLAPAEARFEVRPAAPLASSPQPERQAANDKVRKLALHFPGTSQLRLAVLLVPLDGKAVETPEVKPLEEW
jgi:hypothetical protein